MDAPLVERGWAKPGRCRLWHHFTAFTSGGAQRVRSACHSYPVYDRALVGDLLRQARGKQCAKCLSREIHRLTAAMVPQ